MTTESNTELHRVSISAQAHALAELARKSDDIKRRVESLCSELGLLTQQHLIINEAMRITLTDLAGGVIAPCPTYKGKLPDMFGLE